MAQPLPYQPEPGTTRRARMAEIARNFRFAFGYSWRANPAQTAAIVAVPMVESLLPAALALVLRGLVNATLSEAEGGSGGWSVSTFVLVSLALSVALAVAQSLRVFLADTNTEALEHRVAQELIAHADTLDFGHFERPEFQDTLTQARMMPGHHIHEMVAKCVRAVSLLITLGTLLGILAAIEPLLLVFLVPLSVPYLMYRTWVARTRYTVRFAQNRSRRWIEYYTGRVTSEELLPEVRALDLGPLFEQRVGERLDTIHHENRRSFRLELFGSSAFNSLAVFVIHIALFSAANRAADGTLTAGDIAVFAGAATGLRSSLDAFVTGIGSLRWHMPHLTHLQTFFAIPPSASRTDRVVGSAVGPGADNAPPLVLRDVSFTYPGTTRPILSNLSLTVEQGETVGLVGRNGSGKSTLVKLVNGLYPPDDGAVEIAGVDVAHADFDFLHHHVSTVFQNVGQHNGTAHENIAMGDWRELLDDPDRVREIARQVGLDELIRSLPDGYETTLGRIFGDVSISGGQWQTFAIARAFARPTPLMILDEPTASLDPEAEFEVFERFKELAVGRATLLISHRFSTLALADRIVVLNNGRAEEQGTHDELVALDGTYAHLHRLFRQRGETGIWSADENPGA